jgi:DNA-binding beta-propeller fold protein YncE
VHPAETRWPQSDPGQQFEERIRQWKAWQVTRIDAASGKTTTITVGLQPVGIAHADSWVWVTNQGDGTVSSIDGDALWVGTVVEGVGQSVQIDAKTRKVLRHSMIGPTPNDPDVLDGGVWFPDKNGSLYRVGQRDGAVTGPWKLGGANPFIAAAWDGRLWIADFGGTDVLVVDPANLPPS